MTQSTKWNSWKRSSKFLSRIRNNFFFQKFNASSRKNSFRKKPLKLFEIGNKSLQKLVIEMFEFKVLSKNMAIWIDRGKQKAMFFKVWFEESVFLFSFSHVSFVITNVRLTAFKTRLQVAFHMWTWDWWNWG
jgi:hypothetical protein